jgi:hypothetical protein
MYPTISKMEMDGEQHDKIACPKCGLAVYAKPDAAVTALERWNSINRRDERLMASKAEARSFGSGLSKADIERGMDEASVAFNFRSSSWFEDEEYNAFD